MKKTIKNSKIIKGGSTMKKMSASKAKCVKGGASVTKQATPSATGSKATKEKVVKKNLIKQIDSLSSQLADLKKELKANPLKK